MPRKKLQQFAEMKAWPHVFEWGFDSDPRPYRGKWSDYFKNENPLVLELACGRGDYTVSLAERFPGQNFIGVDVKGARIWHGAKSVLDEGLTNVAFVRIRIEDLAEIFAPNEVTEIWITFPDPHPRKGRERRRLTSPRFLEMYRSLLSPGGKLHLKTDHEVFFDYSLESFSENGWPIQNSVRDLYGSGPSSSLLTEIQTTYERRHLAEGRTIYYLCATRP